MCLIKKLFVKYKEIILYLIFGALTTLINVVSYTLFSRILGIGWQISNLLAFVLSVLFAYITNRRYIFASKNKNYAKEIFLFFFFRILTLGMDMLLMYIFITGLGIHDVIAKIAVQFTVILLNYLFSKLIVFK